MPLFICARQSCSSVENTALGDYWGRKRRGMPPLCSGCSDVKGRRWHGRFERRRATPEMREFFRNGTFDNVPGGFAGLPLHGYQAGHDVPDAAEGWSRTPLVDRLIRSAENAERLLAEDTVLTGLSKEEIMAILDSTPIIPD